VIIGAEHQKDGTHKKNQDEKNDTQRWLIVRAVTRRLVWGVWGVTHFDNSRAARVN